MKILVPVFIFISLVSSVFLSGCSMTSSESGALTIVGIVFDTTVTPSSRIQGAFVTMVQSGNTYTTTSDSTGTFTFANISAGDCEISISKYNYYKFTKTYTVSSDSVTYISVSMVPKSVYVFNNIIIEEYTSSSSLSAVNFLTGLRVQDMLSEKDAQIRDTLIGTDTMVYLRSAAMDNINPGNATYFTNSILRTYTKTEFDTLSKYPTIDNYLNPYRDFPNQEGMDRFFSYGKHQNVCAFYLYGRWPGSGAYRTFGLLYVDSVWYDNSTNMRKMLIDIKINTKEMNEFNPNPTK